MYKTESYNPGACCGDDCYFDHYSTEDEPCWGDVHVIDEITAGDDWWWVHACQGHTNYDWTGAEKNVYVKSSSSDLLQVHPDSLE